MARRARAVGGGQGGAAVLQVPGPRPRLRGARDGQRVDGVGVAVAVAVVGVVTAVTARPHEDGALVAAPLRHAPGEGLPSSSGPQLAE